MSQARLANPPGNELDLRRFRRVSVRLRVSVVVDRQSVFEASTCNVSEGGMLLEDYRGPQLAPGRLVGINMGGVISDGDEVGNERYLMRVVRHEGDLLALRFDAGAG